MTKTCFSGMSVTMLKKRLRGHQWASVGLLMGGLVLVHLDQAGAMDHAQGNALVGFSAVLLACTCAGVAGCYLEAVLKASTRRRRLRSFSVSFYGGDETGQQWSGRGCHRDPQGGRRAARARV